MGLSQGEFSILLVLLNPFAPHITEELWQLIGNEGMLHETSWPEYDPAKIIDDEIEIVVQINGKVRDKLLVAKDADNEEIKNLCMETEKVKKLIEGKTIVKVITVPGKLVNIVVK